MRKGLVLARVGTVPPKKVLIEIRSIEGVLDAYAVFGRFDIVVFIEAENYNQLKEIASDIAKVEGMKGTETLVHGD